MRFEINLATKIYLNTRRLRLCTAAALLLLAALLFYNVRNIGARAEEMKRLTNEMAAMEDRFKVESKGIPEKEYNALLARIGFANAVIEKKTYNWLALLDALEQTVPDGVAITSIEPEPKSQGLKLAGVARGFNNLRIFMERLEDSEFFTDLYLQSQGDAKLSETIEGITFSLTCRVTGK